MEQIVFIGPGRVGTALAMGLTASDPDLSILFHGRAAEPPEHHLFDVQRARYRTGIERPTPGTTAVFLTVPDGAISEVATTLAARGEPPSGCSVFHCCGAFDAEVLSPLQAVGYAVGTFHPFRAITPDPMLSDLSDAVFALSGEPLALGVARRLVAALGASAITVPPGGRTLYHAAATVGSNYLVTLLATAAGMLRRAGIAGDAADAALVSLVRGTIDNVAAQGAEYALTGPLVRGDVETVALHLRALPEEDAAFYAALGRRTVALMEDRIEPSVADRLNQLFVRYQ